MKFFFRRCLSTSSIPWSKKVQNDQKLKSRGSCLVLCFFCNAFISWRATAPQIRMSDLMVFFENLDGRSNREGKHLKRNTQQQTAEKSKTFQVTKTLALTLLRHWCQASITFFAYILKRQCHDNRWFLAVILCGVGKNNGGHKARPRRTTVARGKRHFLDWAWQVKLFARLTELSWCDVRDTCVSSRLFFLAQKSAKKHWKSWHCPFFKDRSKIYSQDTLALSLLQSVSRLGRSPTSSNAAALIFRVSVLFFEAKSHLHFVFAFTQQR